MTTTPTARTDIHRPSEARYSEYRWLGCFYIGANEDIAEGYADEEAALNDRLAAHYGVDDGSHLRRTGDHGVGGNFARKSTCDHCGAVFAHGVIFLHEPSNEWIAVGHTCAGEHFAGDEDEMARIRRLAEKNAKRLRSLRENEVIRRMTLAMYPGLAEALETDHHIARNLKKSFMNSNYPGLSSKAIALAFKVPEWVKENAERDAKREAERATAEPVPVTGDRITVTGEVVKHEWKETNWGSREVMTVKDDRGFLVWGTVPSKLSVDRGDRISFDCLVERSDRDDKFGFFKRPTKARVID